MYVCMYLFIYWKCPQQSPCLLILVDKLLDKQAIKSAQNTLPSTGCALSPVAYYETETR